MPVINRIKHAIARYLLADEVKRVDLERESFQKISERYKANIEDFEAYKRSLTVTDLVREQLKGFNPRLLDPTRRRDEETGSEVESFDDLPEVLGEVEDQESFLAACKSLQENKAFPIIADYLLRNQILFSAKEAVGLAEIDFGRSTVNGIQLLREEVARLATVHAERHAAKPTFDEHEVV